MVTQTASVLVKPSVIIEQPQASVHGRIITTKIVGVSFEFRQESIAKMHIGDRVWLETELDNPHDHNAIMVSRSNGEELGYLNRRLAANLSYYFEKYGKPVIGKVRLLTGSAYDGYSLGVVISFKVPKLTLTYENHRKHQFIEWED